MYPIFSHGFVTAHQWQAPSHAWCHCGPCSGAFWLGKVQTTELSCLKLMDNALFFSVASGITWSGPVPVSSRTVENVTGKQARMRTSPVFAYPQSKTEMPSRQWPANGSVFLMALMVPSG